MGMESSESQLKALVASVTRVAKALEGQVAAHRELVLWARLGAREEATSFFEKTLDSEKKRWVYEAHDGKATQKAIHRETLVPQQTVSRWALEWESLGILVDLGGGTRRKIIPLSALGIDVPPLPSSQS
jgi:hypothetical protein